MLTSPHIPWFVILKSSNIQIVDYLEIKKLLQLLEFLQNWLWIFLKTQILQLYVTQFNKDLGSKLYTSFRVQHNTPEDSQSAKW